MTDTPDLRTLATVAAHDVDCPDGPNCREDLTTYGRYGRYADAVLAAVLPEHRRQVLRDYADQHHRLGGGHGPLWAGTEPIDPDAWCQCGASWSDDEGGCTERVQLLADAASAIRRLASAAPETAPSPRQDDETAPAVGREAAEAQGPAEGTGWVPLAEVLDALRDHDAFVEWTRANGPSGYLADYVGRDDRDACARYLADRFATAPQGADATPADGQDGDGHG